MRKPNERREPILGLGVKHAIAMRNEIGYARPTDVDIDVLAYMRGAIVRRPPTSGARANLLRVGARGVISVAASLPEEQRRWAIAHELGHFEAHAAVSYLGLCTGEDMLLDYLRSGREQEANAFAAELLMPQDLFEPRCDVEKVKWEPIVAAAQEFKVSVTAAALRFLVFTWERVAVVMCKDGKVAWHQRSEDFGPWPKRKGTPVDQWSLAYDYFKKGSASPFPESVRVDAWIENPRPEDEEVVEHVFPMPRYSSALVLLWFPVRRR